MSVLSGGWRLLLANKRLLLWSYLVLLLAGLVGGASLHARIAPLLDHSLAAEKLAAGVDVGYYAELFEHADEHDPGNGPVMAAITLLSVLFSFFLAAATIFVFITGDQPRLATVLRAGSEYFWRFFRLTLFFMLTCAIILGPLGALRYAYLKHADETYVGAAYAWRSALLLIVLLLAALVLRLWFDLAEVYVVTLGQQGDRRVRRSLRPSLKLLRSHFGRVFPPYFIAGTAGVLGFLLFTWLWAAGQSSHLVLPVFLLSQLALLFLPASRIWQRGIVTALVLAETEQTQTVILVQPGPISETIPIDSSFDFDRSRPLPPADQVEPTGPLDEPGV